MFNTTVFATTSTTIPTTTLIANTLSSKPDTADPVIPTSSEIDEALSILEVKDSSLYMTSTFLTSTRSENPRLIPHWTTEVNSETNAIASVTENLTFTTKTEERSFLGSEGSDWVPLDNFFTSAFIQPLNTLSRGMTGRVPENTQTTTAYYEETSRKIFNLSDDIFVTNLSTLSTRSEAITSLDSSKNWISSTHSAFTVVTSVNVTDFLNATKSSQSTLQIFNNVTYIDNLTTPTALKTDSPNFSQKSTFSNNDTILDDIFTSYTTPGKATEEEVWSKSLLGVPVIWWAVSAAIFFCILLLIFLLVCAAVSKRRWKKKNQHRRGYLDDQLTSSFIKSYADNEITPSRGCNKKKEKTIVIKGNKEKSRCSYPKSYRLGPRLLPLQADAIRLRPSVSSSRVATPSTFDSTSSEQVASNDKLNKKYTKVVNGGDTATNKINLSVNKDNPSSEVDFGTWRKPGMAAFGGFIPAYKRSSFSNLIENESMEKKSKKSSEDDVFEKESLHSHKDFELTTFCYRNPSPVNLKL